MKNIISLIVMFVTLTFANAQIADTIIKNAKIYTADASDTFVQALAIKDGLIIYTGTNTGVNVHLGTGTTIKDAGGRLILPGMHDVHMHPLEASSTNGSSCSLNSVETNPENYITTMQACGSAPNSNGWILGWGHSIYTLLNATRAPRLILDEVYPTTPALFMEETSHSMWVNTAGLNALGITDSTPDPVGGHIVKSKWGTPTDVDGILLDNAGDAAISVALATNGILQTNNYEGLVYYGLPLLAKNGITSICEGRTYWKQNYIQTWQQIKNNNLLTCRVALAPWIYPDDNDATQIPTIEALYDAGDDMLKIRQIKLYSDGILVNATAAMHDDYEAGILSALGFPFSRGLNYIDAPRMVSLITSLETKGYDFHIHAIGDRGVTESLDAIAAARTTNGDIGARHRVTHLEVVKQTDYSRFSSLNVTADMQVTGDFTNPNHWHDNDDFIGVTRSDNLVPVKSISDAGARVTLSSDWDVSSISPFVGIQNSLTRVPQNLPNVAAAVKAYTINGAYVMRHEDKTGSLEVGKYADLIMVDRDIFTVPYTQIGATKVVFTWLEGNEVYLDTVLSTVENTFNNSKFDVYPTVAHDSIHVYITNKNKNHSSIKVYDFNGKKVIHQNVNSDSFVNNEVKIDVSILSEGIYILKFTNEKGLVEGAKKFIVSY